MDISEYEKINEAVDFVSKRFSLVPSLGIVLGSGLGEFAETIENPIIIPYEDIPHFKKTKVTGHKGRMILGKVAGRVIAVMQGRYHYYEGYDMNEVIFPIRMLCGLGIEKIILTNAAGGINKGLKPGDLMIITDHINMMGANPLRGLNADRWGPRFPDMSDIYDPEMRKIIVKCMTLQEIHQTVIEGIYIACSGPSYETPAEIKMMSIMGADAVGMSTVPEAIAARHMGVKVAAISCITNMAAGISQQKLDHRDVTQTAALVKEKFINLMSIVIQKL